MKCCLQFKPTKGCLCSQAQDLLEEIAAVRSKQFSLPSLCATCLPIYILSFSLDFRIRESHVPLQQDYGNSAALSVFFFMCTTLVRLLDKNDSQSPVVGCFTCSHILALVSSVQGFKIATSVLWDNQEMGLLDHTEVLFSSA